MQWKCYLSRHSLLNYYFSLSKFKTKLEKNTNETYSLIAKTQSFQIASNAAAHQSCQRPSTYLYIWSAVTMFVYFMQETKQEFILDSCYFLQGRPLSDYFSPFLFFLIPLALFASLFALYSFSKQLLLGKIRKCNFKNFM